MISVNFKKMNEREQKQYINDMVNAMYSYVSSDKDSELLKNFVLHIDDIRQQYDYLVNQSEIHERFNRVRICMENSCDSKETDLFKAINEMQNYVEGFVCEVNKFSQLNMLCKLYEKEEVSRRTRIEYLEISNKNPQLTAIIKAIDKERRLPYEEVKSEFGLSDIEMKKLLKNCGRFFNLTKEKDNKIKSISLNPQGKKYIEFMLEEQSMVSQSKIDEVVISNCEALVMSFKASIISGIPHHVEVVGVTPSSERKIRHVYRQNLTELIKTKNELYTYKVGYKTLDSDGGGIYAISKNNNII